MALGLDDETVFVCQHAALDDSQKEDLSLQCLLKTVYCLLHATGGQGEEYGRLRQKHIS